MSKQVDTHLMGQVMFLVKPHDLRMYRNMDGSYSLLAGEQLTLSFDSADDLHSVIERLTELANQASEKAETAQ